MAAQAYGMTASWPGFKMDYYRCNKASWTGQMRPSSLSMEYKVRITYKLEGKPRVSVLSPALQARGDGEPIPHVYDGPELCLYLPCAQEWKPSLLLSETILPWTSLWLFYYETWHSTGVWAGGGVHPGGVKASEATS